MRTRARKSTRKTQSKFTDALAFFLFDAGICACDLDDEAKCSELAQWFVRFAKSEGVL